MNLFLNNAQTSERKIETNNPIKKIGIVKLNDGHIPSDNYLVTGCLKLSE